ncbi:transmembrane protein, putative [Medicago truncatula]|uniref:Transmembrane protein, putative n=1 Tax=Medicago truncatula TaxID=3880 RepID=G7JZ67_MEDTR|nr:transmembrane protein, putative [Medicago truncatula]
MSGLHGGINILFPACGSSSPSPPFARFFRHRPWISSPPVAFLTWLDLFWLLLLTVVGLVRLLVVKTEEVATMCVGLRIVYSGAFFWCSVMAVPIQATAGGGISFIYV